MGKQLEQLQYLADKICAGRYDWEQVALLLVLLRPYVAREPDLYDLINFVTHTEGRDRGSSHGRMQDFLRGLTESGSADLKGPEPLFSKADLIPVLAARLRAAGVVLNDSDWASRGDGLYTVIKALVVDTEFVFTSEEGGDYVVECRTFESVPDGVFMAVRLRNIGPDAALGVADDQEHGFVLLTGERFS